jgi:hypothetical protein
MIQSKEVTLIFLLGSGESLDKLAKCSSIVYFDTTWPGSGVWYIQAEFVPNF